ncbi:MAG: MarR family winged helix-turn-helix transcriptional regulator [Gemmatimonadaceae bacterium]
MQGVMKGSRAKHGQVIDDTIGRLMRRHTTAAVLFHHALAERLGLGPTDLKCLDLLRERGSMTGSELAAATGLTTGAITGVVTRLEGAGYVRRELDPDDGRKQRLSAVADRAHPIHAIFRQVHDEHAKMLDGIDARHLAAIAEFLERSTEAIYRQIGTLRGEINIGPSVARTAVQSKSRTRQRRVSR